MWNSAEALRTGRCHGPLLGEELGLEMGSTGIMLEESTHFLEGIKWIAHAATSTEHLKDLFHFQLSGGSRRRLRSRGMNSVVVNTWTFLLGRIKKKKRINKQTKLPKCYNPKQDNNGVKFRYVFSVMQYHRSGCGHIYHNIITWQHNLWWQLMEPLSVSISRTDEGFVVRAL